MGAYLSFKAATTTNFKCHHVSIHSHEIWREVSSRIKNSTFWVSLHVLD
jgi:enterochelin esterase-like enzyme